MGYIGACCSRWPHRSRQDQSRSSHASQSSRRRIQNSAAAAEDGQIRTSRGVRASLFFTPPVEVDHNPLHLRWSIQIHKAHLPHSYWPNCQFFFEAVIPEGYPSNKPDVRCKTRLYHPNIDDETGAVCLTLLKDWKATPHGGLPQLKNINCSIFETLFQDPNGNDPLPLCKEAAHLILTDQEEFRKRAKAHANRFNTFIPGASRH